MRQALVRALRTRAVDVETAEEAGMVERSDADHLDYAAGAQRVLCTATQIYLTPEQHGALQESARAVGRSMADLIRELVDQHILRNGPPTDLSDLPGSVRTGCRTNVAAERDSMLVELIR